MKQLKKLHFILTVLSQFYPKTTNYFKLIGAILILKKIVKMLISMYKTLLSRGRTCLNGMDLGLGRWLLVLLRGLVKL